MCIDVMLGHVPGMARLHALHMTRALEQSLGCHQLVEGVLGGFPVQPALAEL